MSFRRMRTHEAHQPWVWCGVKACIYGSSDLGCLGIVCQSTSLCSPYQADGEHMVSCSMMCKCSVPSHCLSSSIPHQDCFLLYISAITLLHSFILDSARCTCFPCDSIRMEKGDNRVCVGGVLLPIKHGIFADCFIIFFLSMKKS